MSISSEQHIKQAEPPTPEQIQQIELEAEEGERWVIMAVKWWESAIYKTVFPGGNPLSPHAEVYEYYGYNKIKCKKKDSGRIDMEIFNAGGKVVAECYEDEL